MALSDVRVGEQGQSKMFSMSDMFSAQGLVSSCRLDICDWLRDKFCSVLDAADEGKLRPSVEALTTLHNLFYEGETFPPHGSAQFSVQLCRREQWGTYETNDSLLLITCK